MRLIAVAFLCLILCVGGVLFHSLDRRIVRRGLSGISTGISLPDFKLIATDGSEINSHAAIGAHDSLIVFVNPGCSHCDAQLSALARLEKTTIVTVIADLNQDTEYERHRIAEQYGSRFKLYFDRFGERKQRLGIEIVPYTLLLDRNKIVRLAFEGERDAGFLAEALNHLPGRSDEEVNR